MSAVVVSPFDSVSFLRAAIQADMVKTTISSNNAGHRHGPRGYRGCPSFAFSYADGVAIDRGQEERLLVKDIATKSSPACSVTDDDPRWEGGNEGRESGQGGMLVFLRAGEPRTKQATTDDGAGVLHRWESLQGGCFGDEVRKLAAEDFGKMGGGKTAVGFKVHAKEALPWEEDPASNFDSETLLSMRKQ